MNSGTPLPAVAKALGYSGLLPFVGLALCSVAGVDLSAAGISNTTTALMAYGAVIISFIGAVHWGVALSTKNNSGMYIYSVVPSLLAWLALLLTPRVGLVLMVVTLVAMYLVDRRWLNGLVSAGYLTMRLHLTAVVSVCLLLAMVAV